MIIHKVNKEMNNLWLTFLPGQQLFYLNKTVSYLCTNTRQNFSSTNNTPIFLYVYTPLRPQPWQFINFDSLSGTRSTSSKRKKNNYSRREREREKLSPLFSARAFVRIILID